MTTIAIASGVNGVGSSKGPGGTFTCFVYSTSPTIDVVWQADEIVYNSSDNNSAVWVQTNVVGIFLQSILTVNDASMMRGSYNCVVSYPPWNIIDYVYTVKGTIFYLRIIIKSLQCHLS